jgi:ubiquitin-protein ligase E3 C
LLISGGLNDIDMQDLQQNVQYNGYSKTESYIKEFWAYLDSLPNKQKEKFLLFVTGSDRPPLLGFKYMNPQMMIARDHADGGDPKNRFPTAATCMNMLRLPKYRSKEDMKRTIDYVINSNQGFGLG